VYFSSDDMLNEYFCGYQSHHIATLSPRSLFSGGDSEVTAPLFIAKKLLETQKRFQRSRGKLPTTLAIAREILFPEPLSCGRKRGMRTQHSDVQ
jgi:hypothetical protein